MSDPIPPRPWRIGTSNSAAYVHDAQGCIVLRLGHGVSAPDAETAKHIVRLVNAETEVVEALEAADKAVRVLRQRADGWRRDPAGVHGHARAEEATMCLQVVEEQMLAAVRAALSKVRR